MSGGFDRRGFMRAAAGVGLLGGAGAVLDACSSSSKKSSSTTATTVAGASGTAAAAGSLGSINFQLSWIENDEFSGEYLADTRGYYTQVGFSGVNLLSGGPSVNQDSVVASGKAFAGISSPDITSSAINNGADLIIVAALYQKNPFAIMSMASTPIHNPQEMIGKKIGVQSTNDAVWHAFLKANHIDPSQVTEVPVQFDPTPLTTHTVDGWFSFITNEPNELKAKGFDTYTFLLNDYNYPLVSETIMVETSALTTGRDKLKALLHAEILGWRDSLADPSAGPHLAVTKYGKSLGLDESEQTLESIAQNTLILTPDTQANGILTLTPAAINNTISTLALAGTTIAANKLFDTSAIDEVYQEYPELKTPPPSAATTIPPTTA